MDESSVHHEASRAVLERAQSPDAKLCIVPQSLAEFFSLVTNPRRVSSPKSTAEALATVEAILSLPGLDMLAVPWDVVSRWIDLCRQHPVQGAGVYDLQIIAVMLANEIQQICTFNTADFEPFPEITVAAP
jgi:hypothetical protein